MALVPRRGSRSLIAVPKEAKARITECTDLDQLDAWIRRAVTATRIEDVLD